MSAVGQHILIRCIPDMRIELDEHALQVRQGMANPRRFPLDRLGLVTMVGEATIPTCLLTELAGRGIALRFMRQPGAPDIALVLGTQPPHTGIDGDLDALAFHIGWRERYIGWRVRQDFWGALRALRGRADLRLGLSDMRPMTVAAALNRHRPEPMTLLRAIGPMLRAEAIEALHAKDWPVHRLRAPRPGIHALRDVVRALTWEAIAALAEASEATSPEAWYTRNRSLLQSRAGLTIDALCRLIRQTTCGTMP